MVIVEDHSVIEAIAAEEGSAQGGSAKFAVLVLAGSPLYLPRMPNGVIASRDRQLKSRFPDRLERPPASPFRLSLPSTALLFAGGAAG